MSKFHQSLIIFLLLEGLLFGAFLLGFGTLHSLWILGILYSILMGWASMNMSFDFYIKSTYSLSTPTVLLSFDDGPHPVYTPIILQILKDRKVKAQFFLIGKQAEKHPEIVKQIVAEGHEIGGHSYSHLPSFGFQFGKKITNEIMVAQNLLSGLIGTAVMKFRPPFGVINPHIAQVIKKNGLEIVGWSCRSFDTVKGLTSQRITSIAEQVKPGDIVLLHDTIAETSKNLNQLIDELKYKGITFEPLK